MNIYEFTHKQSYTKEHKIVGAISVGEAEAKLKHELPDFEYESVKVVYKDIIS